jgi:hypothetical protein
MDTKDKIIQILHSNLNNFFNFEALNFISVIEEFISDEAKRYLEQHTDKLIKILSESVEQRVVEIYQTILTDEEIDRLYIILNDPLVKKYNGILKTHASEKVGIEIAVSSLRKIADLLPNTLSSDKMKLRQTVADMFENCN